MHRRFIIGLLLASCLILTIGCRNKSVKNPLASIDSKQPDKVLFDRAMDAMKKRKYDVSRLSLQTLINTYPDSEYVARAKLAIGDAWLAEGGSAALAQAENEYRDFITFFPNMPEASEAQLKIADIHYRQIEKPDRDFTHARRAEDEYRQLLLQYPDSKLADKARTRLLEVQEILGDREFRIGRFYYLRQSWAASIARLKTLTDTYPLYSQSDEALFMLGQAHEKQIDSIRAVPTNKLFTEQKKAQLIKMYTDGANEAYSKIITRYPVMPRAADAKARLKAMDLSVPTPTEEAIALNKKEEASRSELGRMGKIMLNMHKRPDFSRATKEGQPTLVDPKTTDAPDLVKEATAVFTGKTEGGGSKVSAETVKAGDGTAPAENQPVPRSDSNETILPEKDTPKPMPDQVNEAAHDGNATPTATPTDGTATQSDLKTADTKSDSSSTDTKKQSSSKEKKKKGLRKIIPF
jgi:outer membrane protein assembly factor BamD